MPWIVRNISLKQQLQCGSIQNVIVSVTAVENSIPAIGDYKGQTFTVDDKVKVFFKPRFECSELILCVNIQKKESVQNCNVEITCQEFRKVISCSKEWIEVQLDPINSEQCLMGVDFFQTAQSMQKLRSVSRQYIIEVDITIHEIMSIHTKLYEYTEFTDFQLKAADGAVAVHKAILAFQSDVFKTMLNGEWKETVEGCMNIDGVTIETLQRLKDYMYLGTLPEKGLEPLILLAEHYLMDKLKSDCITKLVKSVKRREENTLTELLNLLRS